MDVGARDLSGLQVLRSGMGAHQTFTHRHPRPFLPFSHTGTRPYTSVMVDSKLVCETKAVGDGYLVALSGVFDEHAADVTFTPTTEQPVVFDLDGVKRITSCGVLHWRKSLASMNAETYLFARVRPAMVRQFNMVAGFGVSGLLLSIYAPYYCEECDIEFQLLHDLAADPRIMLNRRLPVTTCKGCGAQAELDESLDGYLAFADDYLVPKLDLKLRRIISAMKPPIEDEIDEPQPKAAGG